MHLIPNPKLRSFVALAAVALSSTPLLLAQAAQNQPAQASSAKAGKQAEVELSTEDTIMLSPFEVSADNNTGYGAASSLAGNRLNTELKDVGSAISVVTSQLLKDIGATSNESLLQYTTNTEVGNIYGNMANAGNGTQLDETSKFANPNSNTRVRGLASADATMDYFLTDIPWDSYNVDRIDFQRGPNAILFGLGSPAGIINAGTKTASFKDRGSVEVKFSRFGSIRESLDVNQVLLRRELSLRLNLLNNEEKFQQTQAFQNDRRVAGALRYEPAFLNKGESHTTIRVSGEAGEIRSNRPRSLTPGDSITPWFYTGTSTGYDEKGNAMQLQNLNRIGFDARGLQDANITSIGDPTRGQFNKTFNNSGGLVSGSQNPAWQAWLGGAFSAGYFGNPMALFSSGDNPSSTLINWEPTTVRGVGPTGAIDKTIGGIASSRMSSVTGYRDISKKENLPGAKFGLTKNIVLSDPTIFDFYNQLIDGPNKKEWQNFHRSNISLSQTFLGGSTGFEMVYDKQHYDNGQVSFMSDKGQALYIDLIKTEADGSVNPNFGRPYIADSGPGGWFANTDRESYRVTAFGKYDFERNRSGSWLTKLLGRHTVTGMFSDDKKLAETRNFVQYVADNGYKDFVNGYGSTAQYIDSNIRKVNPVIYLGPSLANATTASGAFIKAPTVLAKVTSGSVRAFDSTWVASGVNPADVWENPMYPVGHKYRASTQSENPANYRGWMNTPVTVTDSEDGNRDLNTTKATKGKNTVESKALNWQGYFWNGSLVGMYGYREDTAKSWSVTSGRDAEGRAITDHSSYSLPSQSILVKQNSNSWSTVLHLNNLFHQKLPLNVSLFVNKSENFQPLAGRVGVFNNPLTPPKGNTTDLGLLFSTKDGKYTFKVNKYKTSVKDSNGTSNFSSFYLAMLFTDYQKARNQYVFEVKDGTNPGSYHEGEANNWIYQPVNGQSEEQAIAAQKQDIAGWDSLVKSTPKEFFSAWRMDMNQNTLSDLKVLNYTTPSGFTITEDNVSKGLEFELTAEPVSGLRLTINATKSEAERNNVGDPSFNALVNNINTALNTTAAGSLRNGNGSTATTALQAWNANFWASWLSVKGQEGNAVPELRRWHSNLIANYEFSRGFVKGVNVGTAFRWQDRVVLGYKPRYYVGTKEVDPWTATSAKFDLSSPYYGPAEKDLDLWIGYSHMLGKKLKWRTQLNLRNVGKRDGLIPITVQPDGTVATWRIQAPMIWSLTNSLEF